MSRFSVVFVVVLIGAHLTVSWCSPVRFGLSHIRSLMQPSVCPDGVCDSGESPPEWRFPFLALVKNSSGSAVCSGSLLHENVVLTAAHCVDILENPRVEMGVFGAPGGGFESFGTKAKIVHPDFNHDEDQVLDTADVALLILDKPAKNARPVALADSQHTGCFTQDGCMQVNMPAFWESPEGSGRHSIKNQRVIAKAWNQCWASLGSPHREKDPAICISGIQDNKVSCTGDGGPMMSSKWQQSGIMSFKDGCTNTTANTAHTLITPDIKAWIDGQVEEIKAGRLAGKTNGGIIAPPYCIFRNGFWFGGSDCKKLPKPAEERGCYFLHGTWFGSDCPQTQQEEQKEKPKPEAKDRCAFLFGRWIGKNCDRLTTLPPKKAGCIFLYGKFIGAGC